MWASDVLGWVCGADAGAVLGVGVSGKAAAGSMSGCRLHDEWPSSPRGPLVALVSCRSCWAVRANNNEAGVAAVADGSEAASEALTSFVLRKLVALPARWSPCLTQWDLWRAGSTGQIRSGAASEGRFERARGLSDCSSSWSK